MKSKHIYTEKMRRKYEYCEETGTITIFVNLIKNLFSHLNI